MHLDGPTTTQETPIDTRDLICPICMSIAEDPQVTSCCHRVFCVKDANPSQYENGCPLCREKNYSFQPSARHKEMLDHLTIKCACSERVIPQEYENHLERCSNVTFTCPHNICREKNDLTKYNSQELVNHLARSHCDEVPLLGSTYVKKSSVEPYKKVSMKYDDLVSTLYSVLYPKMVDIQLKNTSMKPDNSSMLKCPQGHKLIDADRTKRKRKNGSVYTSAGFNCDICHRSFSSGQSWHCSCTDSGFDKCVACLAFQLYDIDDNTLKVACEDKEEQQQRYRRETVRNIVRLPHGLFRLLTGNIDEDEDDDDDVDLLALRHQSPYLRQQSMIEGRDDEEFEVNRRED